MGGKGRERAQEGERIEGTDLEAGGRRRRELKGGGRDLQNRTKACWGILGIGVAVPLTIGRNLPQSSTKLGC